MRLQTPAREPIFWRVKVTKYKLKVIYHLRQIIVLVSCEEYGAFAAVDGYLSSGLKCTQLFLMQTRFLVVSLQI